MSEEHPGVAAEGQLPYVNPPNITPREKEILGLIAEGLTNQQIAERLWVSIHTVHTHVAHLRKKFQVPNRVVLMREAQRLGYVPSISERSPFLAIGDEQRRGYTPCQEVEPRRSREAVADNLPRQLSRFIGREHESTEIQSLLGAVHLLTLTGAGGCGKTRLALHVAADLVERFADGVWRVEFAALSDPALVPQAVASVLGVRGEPDRPLTETLADSLRSQSLLLVLDNCEHLLSACAQLAENLLRRCLNLRILATSREALGLSGEQTYRVPSLSLPDASQGPAVDGRWGTGSAIDPPPSTLLQYEAVRLFVDRATLSQLTFALTRANAHAVLQVCHRLDGIPLAIELAAARLEALPVDQIATRLDDCFRLLTGGSRTALPRQQTLRATMDWGYDLLTEPEQALLRRLSVFAGGWTLEAAEAVCGECEGRKAKSEHEGAGLDTSLPSLSPFALRLSPFDVLELLASLVRKSLVVYEEQEGRARYRLLETVRQYARDRLMEKGEAEKVQDRHTAHFLGLVEEEAPSVARGERGPRLEPLQRIKAEHDNLLAALEWSRRAPASPDNPLDSRADAWLRKVGNRPQIATILSSLGYLARTQGNYPAARTFDAENLAVSREIGNKKGIAWSLWERGHVALLQGDFEGARGFHEESLSISREIESQWGTVMSLDCLGRGAQAQDDYEAARRFYQEIVAISREWGEKHYLSQGLAGLGEVASAQGDPVTARGLFEEVLTIGSETGDAWRIALGLEGLAKVAAADRDAARAARLLGAAEASREAARASLPPGERQAMSFTVAPYRRAAYDRNLAEVRAALGESLFAATWAEGRALTREQAVPYALEEADLSCSSFSEGCSSAPAAPLRVYLLGRFEVWRPGEQIPITAWQRPKVAALFKWLCLQGGRRVRRDEAMEALWGDLSIERAPRNLATTLSRLRRVLGATPASCLEVEAETLQLTLGEAVWVDTAAFEQHLSAAARCRRAGAADGTAEQCRAALALYPGDLLPDEVFAEWVLPERQRLAELRLNALVTLAELTLAHGDTPEAEALAGQALQQDACDERAVRARMEALARQGQRTEALRCFQQFRRALRRELEADPEEETVRLSHRLRLASCRDR